MNNNIYNYFRGVGDLANPFNFNKRFDEPTYLSFRLIFGDDMNYNYTGFRASNDAMPHPLFMKDINPAVNAFNYQPNVTENIQLYSAVRYLIDANEPTRAKMLQEFIEKFDYLQMEYPYYFQSIDGVADLLKIDTTKGQRILNDKKLTISCLEALDQRMSYLMTLYRKIVWDDVYQRWVLPDMMRYFTLKIYLSEFRTFHIKSGQTGYGQPNFAGATPLQPAAYTKATAINPELILQGVNKNTATQAQLAAGYEYPTYLNILDDILPVWEITCEMCEFDISDVNFEHLSGLNVAGDPVQGAIKFGIKVGNIKELQMYPVFKHLYLNDRKINGISRLKEDETSTEALNRMEYANTLKVAQTRIITENAGHVSGLPYVERANQNNTQEAAYISNVPISKATANETPMFDPKYGGRTTKPIDSTLPNTWIGNALDFGTSYAKNFVNKWVDKGKTMVIPGLGFSFNEVQAAIQSKDIVTAFGLIRKSITTVSNEHIYPSERLNYGFAKETEHFKKSNPSEDLGTTITDTILRQLLLTLSQSDATDNESVELTKAANQVLNDKGLWQKIKDYSLATDLVGKDEINTKTQVQSAEMQQNIKPSDFKTLQIGEIIESVPTSKATNSTLQ